MASWSTTEQHALAILEQDLWKVATKRIQESGNHGGKFLAIAPKFLYHLIVESQKLGGSVLDQFWDQLGACNTKLKENIKSLKPEAFVSAQRSFDVLFQGLNPEDIDFKPVLAMADEFFTHLGVVFMNLAERTSAKSTAYSVSDAVKESMPKLLQQVHQEGVSTQRKEASLKALLFKRDGESCLLTHAHFVPFDDEGVDPVLGHIIPNSVGGKQETLECIAMFAGRTAAEEVAMNLSETCNVMNMQVDAHSSYNKMWWGIEAMEEGGEVKYLFRRIPTLIQPIPGPGFIVLMEGDQIQFGTGPDREELGNGPIPRLCNLHLAVARVLRMSSAANIILEWTDAADDEGGCGLFIADEEYCDMLDAKLLLTGRAVVRY